MPEITEFCNNDRVLIEYFKIKLEKIEYYLKTIAAKFGNSNSCFYDMGDDACVINLSKCIYFLKSSQGADILFYFSEENPPFIKIFETKTARDAEFECLKKMLKEARDE